MFFTKSKAAAFFMVAALSLLAQRSYADSTTKQVVQTATRGTVLIENGNSFGTGWVLDKARKLIITNHHVVKSADFVVVKFPAYENGRVIHERPYYQKITGVRGRVIDSDMRRDLAIVQVDSLPDGTQELKLAQQGVEAGDRVHSVGNAGASSARFVYSTGVVRTVHHNIAVWPEEKTTQVSHAKKIEFDGGQSGGDSGSALLNDNGEVVGVHHSGNTNNQRYSNGIELSELKTYLHLLEQLLNPTSAVDFLFRGERHVRATRVQSALNDLTQSLQMDANNAVALSRKAQCLNMLGRFDEAHACLTKALEINPLLPAAHTNLAIVLLGKGDHQAAVKHCGIALQGNKKETRALWVRAQANVLLGQATAAIADIDTFLKADDANFAHALPSIFNIRGSAYRKNKQYNAALDDFLKAAKLNPKAAAPLISIGDMLMSDLKQYEKAILAYEEALRVDPKNDVTVTNIGYCLCELKRFSKAAPVLQKALQINAKNATACNNLGWALNELGRHNEALKHLNTAIQLNPRLAWGYWNRGIAYRRLGYHNQAERDFQQAVALNPALANR